MLEMVTAKMSMLVATLMTMISHSAIRMLLSRWEDMRTALPRHPKGTHGTVALADPELKPANREQRDRRGGPPMCRTLARDPARARPKAVEPMASQCGVTDITHSE